MTVGWPDGPKTLSPKDRESFKLCESTHSKAQSSMAGAIKKPWRYRPLSFMVEGWVKSMQGKLSVKVGLFCVFI